jgi:hypothetical protein
MKPEAVNLEAYMDANAALLGLNLQPEHRPGVLRYLQLVSALAPRVTAFAATLGPAEESGNTFKPVSPTAPVQP